jgi:hypothetical protein
LVDPITRQQIDTKADIAGINPIDLPSGATPRSIVVDSRDQYAYIADGKAGGNSIYVLDINPVLLQRITKLPKLSQLVQHLAVCDRWQLAAMERSYLLPHPVGLTAGFTL